MRQGDARTGRRGLVSFGAARRGGQVRIGGVRYGATWEVLAWQARRVEFGSGSARMGKAGDVWSVGVCPGEARSGAFWQAGSGMTC